MAGSNTEVKITGAENVKKNVSKNPIPNSVPFTSERQPSPEAKKKGWERRQQAQKIMDKIMELKDMTLLEFEALQADIKANPDKHTVIELKLAQYVNEEKNTIDFLDRHISKAPIQQEMDVTTKGEKLSTMSLTDLLYERSKLGIEPTEAGHDQRPD